MTEGDVEDFVSLFLESGDLEELLDHFNLTGEEAFMVLFNDGYIDEELLKELAGYG